MAEKDERLYMIYEETRDGMRYVHDEHAENPDKALQKAAEKGFIESGERFTVIADSNINKRRA